MSRAVTLAVALGAATMQSRAQTDWLTTPPESLPPVTVRWDDTEQQEQFTVAGADYACRVATHPARILGLAWSGRELLGAGGLETAFVTAAGDRFAAAPRDLTPKFEAWRRAWVPASSSRARMNVWSCGPYYWDAHLLEIPYISDAAVAAIRARSAAPPLIEWRFDTSAAGWESLQACTLEPAGGALRITATGDDPFCQGPPVDLPGPLQVAVRMRTTVGGAGTFYWTEADQPGYRGEAHATFGVTADGRWHEYLVPLPLQANLTRLRFDPPGTSGTVEVEWIRLLSAPADDPHLPPTVRGEWVFHAHPDHLRLELRWETIEGAMPPAQAQLIVDGALSAAGEVAGRPVAQLGEVGLLLPAGSSFADNGLLIPLSGTRPGATIVLRALPAGADSALVFAPDVSPLPNSAVTVRGGHWLGFDFDSGLYRMQSQAQGASFAFNPAYDSPTRRMEIDVALRGDAVPRRLPIQCASGAGTLPATVLTDRNGMMLPVPVQSCKNFAGELEEPDDSAYGDAYFSVDLAAGETREFRVMHLFQRWGDHMLKQVTSIRFFLIYWHLSTGVSETTCFNIPWQFVNNQYIIIPDFRPYSGPFWSGQPQHDVPSFPCLVQYQSGGERVRVMYQNTTFESIAPNLARFRMDYRLSDGAGRASMTVMEVPHDDEMRTFLRLRYDWDRAVSIDGDARETFRWFHMNDRRRARELLWTAADGSTQQRAVEPGRPLLRGEPLCAEAPFLASHGMPGTDPAPLHGTIMLVQSYRARLGGEDQTAPFASAEFRADQGDYWFCAPSAELTLQPGDFIECDLMLMTHGESVEPRAKPERERVWWAMEGPAAEVSIGRHISDLPIVVAADDEVARFRVSGGHSALPVIVSGFRDWSVPLLWHDGWWQNQQGHGGDGWQVNADPGGGYRFVFALPFRHGMNPELTVTRATCTTGIARLVDRSGYPELQSDAVGEFTLDAPMLFAPGLNEVRPGRPHHFAGTAQAVRAVPWQFNSDQPARVEIGSWSEEAMTARVTGTGELVLGGLAVGAVYELTRNGAANRETSDGRLTVRCEGETELAVRRLE